MAKCILLLGKFYFFKNVWPSGHTAQDMISWPRGCEKAPATFALPPPRPAEKKSNLIKCSEVKKWIFIKFNFWKRIFVVIFLLPSCHFWLQKRIVLKESLTSSNLGKNWEKNWQRLTLKKQKFLYCILVWCFVWVWHSL